MTLVDTSAWVEHLRGGREDVQARVRALVESGSVLVTEPIEMELLAGARDGFHARTISNMIRWAAPARVQGLADWEAAAAIYRACRRSGFTPRSQLDCLIAAVAIREDVPVLHADRDFDGIARHTPLRVAALD